MPVKKKKDTSKIPLWIEIKKSTIPGAGMGAFTQVTLRKGARLGEYLGRRIAPEEYERMDDNRYVFEVKVEDEVVEYIDGRQRRTSNWTRYVNCARTQAEENLLALQEGRRIFYHAKRAISPGEELLVWYGPAYGEWLLGKTEPDA